MLQNGLVVDSTARVTIPVATFVSGLDEILNESSGIYPLARKLAILVLLLTC